MNNITKLPGNIPLLDKTKHYGFDINGACRDCISKNICGIFKHFTLMQVAIYPEDFRINVELCKWHNPVKDGS